MKDLLFIIGVVFSVVLSVGLSYQKQRQNQGTDILSKQFENPILPRIEQFERSYDVNLSTVKQLVPGDLFSPHDISLLHDLEKNYDVLIFGDSSVYMGFSPQVLRQITNKKVGIFSYAALSMNEKLIDFIAYTSDALLKKNGLILFVFNHAFWGKGFQTEQENPELEQLINQRDLYDGNQGCFFCAFNQKRHFEVFEKSIMNYFGLPEKTLISFSFYNDHLAQYVTPNYHAKKTKNLNNRLRRGRYIFDKSFVFVHMQSPNMIQKKPPFSELKPYKNNNIQMTANQLEANKFNFAFVIPLTTDDSMRESLHRIYETYFTGRLMADMNQLMPDDWVIEGQNLTHMSNLGSFRQAVLLSQWLNRYYAGETVQAELNRVIKH